METKLLENSLFSSNKPKMIDDCGFNIRCVFRGKSLSYNQTSVATFEQSKRFTSASLRNWKKTFLSIAKPPFLDHIGLK